ncbi:DUF4982 domain-containing protein [Bacteroides xylanisolvens]|uniref:alpha-L-fucosidase n=1 Tax=Bacteroides xylanisolvens TaxID=371601 RepID=A0A7J5Q185_9BACE|nr:alpha-L-fucosidase [Bacteroides xylanisolvens]KAB6149044.1 DUF4982 domain-containing protein [Bacteroides xylanisolvens]
MMKDTILKNVIWLLFVWVTSTNVLSGYAQGKGIVEDFLNHRFGMFIHFNMGTFHGEQWAKPGHDPKSFNPRFLDCNQWAEGALSAGMAYGVLTTKHHDGFCLWDSQVTDYDVASSSYKGDIVKQYVDAFRRKGLSVGLYFSVWDRQHGIEKGKVTSAGIEYTKKQLTELLTNYGEIICLVIDGWGSIWGQSPTFEEIPFEILADHIHSIQPNCLVINHSCKTDRAYTQIVHYEATHGQHCPYDNTIPSQQGPTMQPRWFWEKGFEKLSLKPLEEILSELDFCNSHFVNYLLNAAPNDFGKMDDNVMRRLAEIGEAWIKPAPMAKLVKETKPNAKVKAVAVYNKSFVPSNVLDADLYTVWQAKEGDEKPEIVLDFGESVTFNKIICGEGHKCKDVEVFEFAALRGTEWITIVKGTKMGFHFEQSFEDITARKFKLTITKFKRTPKIAEITFVKYNHFKPVRLSRSGERDFNRNWKFSLNNQNPEAYFVAYDDNDWRSVNLPHDWSIEHVVDSVNGDGATAYLPGGLGWYRKSFVTPQKKNQRAYVVFDGVYNNSEVWINGKLATTHPYGYSPFVVDITDYLLPYERGGRYITNTNSNEHLAAIYRTAMNTHRNILAVKVDRQRHIDSRWYTGSGIYRNVRLVVVDNLHIPIWGTFVTTPQVSNKQAEVQIEIELKNCYDTDAEAVLLTEFFDPAGKKVAECATVRIVNSCDEEKVKQAVSIANPELWDISSPNLYTACTTLSMNGKLLESYHTKFGIRSIRFDVDKGFFLNGESLKIKGVCLHHDGGIVGAAVPKDVWRRRLIKLKASGANAIRIAHNPASDELLDLCDELGFLVQEEFFDEWDNPKDKRTNLALIKGDYPTTGYTEHFQEWAERDIKTVMKRGRNHPSIFQWSIGNEIEWCYLNSILASGQFSKDQKKGWFFNEPPYTQDKIKELYFDLIPQIYDQAKTAKKLARWTREMDTTRFVTANYILPSASLESGAIAPLDVAGFSYRASLYDRAHKRMPDKPIMGTENRPSWYEWRAALERDYIAGIFIWTGVDYLGEANNRGPFPKISTISGLLDLTGNEKPTYYYMQSMWSDKPMVRLYSWSADVADYKIGKDGEFVRKNKNGDPATVSPNTSLLRRGWNYKDGEEVIVEVYTNCQEVELFLNGKSLGRKLAEEFIADKRMKWFLPFKAGKLEARAYNHGKVVARYDVVTTGKVAGVRLELDKNVITANGRDVIHCVAQLTDSKGRDVLDDHSTGIEFVIDGNCIGLGVDNGFQENINPFKSTKVKCYHGRATYLIQSKRELAKIAIKVVGDGIESKTHFIEVLP